MWGAMFKNMLNVCSHAMLKEWAEKLLRQHRPADLLALPDFMKTSGCPLDVSCENQA